MKLSNDAHYYSRNLLLFLNSNQKLLTQRYQIHEQEENANFVCTFARLFHSILSEKKQCSQMLFAVEGTQNLIVSANFLPFCAPRISEFGV